MCELEIPNFSNICIGIRTNKIFFWISWGQKKISFVFKITKLFFHKKKDENSAFNRILTQNLSAENVYLSSIIPEIKNLCQMIKIARIINPYKRVNDTGRIIIFYWQITRFRRILAIHCVTSHQNKVLISHVPNFIEQKAQKLELWRHQYFFPEASFFLAHSSRSNLLRTEIFFSR